MVERHANWSSREGTPFISITASPEAARWHIAKKGTGHHSTTMVGLIDRTMLLRGTHVWKMLDVMDYFGVLPVTCERRAYDHEYICAVQIPMNAVFACCRPDYHMDMTYVFLKKMERRKVVKPGRSERVVVTIRTPDADAAEAVAYCEMFFPDDFEE